MSSLPKPQTSSSDEPTETTSKPQSMILQIAEQKLTNAMNHVTYAAAAFELAGDTEKVTKLREMAKMQFSEDEWEGEFYAAKDAILLRLQ